MWFVIEPKYSQRQKNPVGMQTRIFYAPGMFLLERGRMSKSIPNLCSPRQHLVETEKKATKQGDQVDTSSSKSFTNKWNPAGYSSTTDKKRPTQSQGSKETKRAGFAGGWGRGRTQKRWKVWETEPAFHPPELDQHQPGVRGSLTQFLSSSGDSVDCETRQFQEKSQQQHYYVQTGLLSHISLGSLALLERQSVNVWSYYYDQTNTCQ